MISCDKAYEIIPRRIKPAVTDIHNGEPVSLKNGADYRGTHPGLCPVPRADLKNPVVRVGNRAGAPSRSPFHFHGEGAQEALL